MITQPQLKSEFQLWRDFINGDDESFHVIYNTHVQPLYRYGCHFTHDHDLVRDCIQDVFVDLQQYRTGLTPHNTNIKLYLFKSLKNKILNALRKMKFFKEADYLSSAFIQINPLEEEIIADEIKLQARVRLVKAFEKLSSRQREALYLKYISDLTYDEIGTILQINYQSARNLIFRSLEKLREGHRQV